MRKKLAICLVALTLGIAGCSSDVDGFKDEETKRLAWDAMNCAAYGRLDAGPVRSDLQLDLLHDNVSPDEVDQAEWWSDRLSKAQKVEDAMQYESGDGFQDMCSGWLWERHKKTSNYMDGYDEFTLEDARDAGIVE